MGMCADPLHTGHINILRCAASHGLVTVGLLTDDAMVSYKGKPMLPYEHRASVLGAIRYVHKVVPQHTLDYRPNLEELRPQVVIHGDDWKTGVQQKTRAQVLACIKQWDGQLVEPRYTAGVCSSDFKRPSTC